MMFKTKISLVAITTAIISAICICQMHKPQVPSIVMENIEALSEYEIIDGKIIISDQIPCASAANEVMIHYSYVNCATCKEEKGQAKGLTGQCTQIRIIDMNGN